MATYTKGKDAPETFPYVDPETGAPLPAGAEFEADYDPDQERAVVAAGWCEPAAKTDKKK